MRATSRYEANGRRLSRALRLSAGLAAVAAGLTACAVPGAPPMVAECSTPWNAGDRPGPALVGQAYGIQMTPLPLNSVQFDSTATSRALAVQQIFASRTPTNTVRVQARVLSCEDAPRAVRMRVTFLRADSSPAEPASAWRTVYLTPRALATYEEVSISRDSSAYLIEVGAP